jgi:quercetin dioxygenase-like cupin family protein
MLKPFVKVLPIESTEYFRVLGESESKNLRSGLVTLKPGENVGEHSTKNYEEILVILNGKGETEINKSERISFEKNMIVYIPPDTIHNVFNNGDSALQYIYIVTLIS